MEATAMAITSLHFSATCSASPRTHKTLFPISRNSTIVRSAWAASTLSSRNVCNREMWWLVKSKNGVLKGRRGSRGVIRAEMFGQLTSDLKAAWNKLKGEEVLIKENIVEPMIDIKKALLEADVSLPVVRRFVQAVSEEAVGLGSIRGVRPDQQLVKILRDELVRLMGGEVSELVFEKSGPTVILLAGLKGVGKTTVCAKLAFYLKKKGKSCMLVAGDVYRPAAIDQLVTLGEQVDVPVYTAGTGVNPEEIAKQGLQEAKRKNLDVVIMDTAGRLQIDKTMMDELKEVKRALNPTEVLLVVDAMTGQQAAALVSTFNLEIGITGAILTKLDRDLRGGAVLSVKEVSGKPIKLVGWGERMEDLEPFYPALMAGRVLGKGVGLSALEMAQVYVEDAEEIEKKILNDEFDFNDMLKQIRAIAPTGTVSRILELMPEVGEFSPAQIRDDERSFKIMIAMMEAMTPEERGNPEILIEFPDRRLRVAQDAGTTASQVNRLIADLLHMRAGYKKLVASRAPPGSKKSDSRSKLFGDYLVSKPRPYLKSGFKKK